MSARWMATFSFCDLAIASAYCDADMKRTSVAAQRFFVKVGGRHRFWFLPFMLAGRQLATRARIVNICLDLGWLTDGSVRVARFCDHVFYMSAGLPVCRVILLMEIFRWCEMVTDILLWAAVQGVRS